MENFKITIIIDSDIKEDIINRTNKLNVSMESYVKRLIETDINNTIKLDNDFYFDKQLDKLFNPLDEEVKLTKIEKNLLKLFLENQNEVLSSQTIHTSVWKGKNMSVYTLRNMIKNLRHKTYYELIKNHSNLGYSFTSYS
jgi:DNA-binding winged helix-turn-helix (wHTH) protein